MTKAVRLAIAGLLLSASLGAWPKGKGKKEASPSRSALDEYVQQASQRYATDAQAAADPGSLWSPSGRLTDLTRDLRAAQVDDMVTIVVAESASAVSTGTVKTARTSSARNSITALAGTTRAAGPWANLANLGGSQTLDGQGTTSRTTDLSATLSARVTNVLPNGYLVVEGTKVLNVNSEHQVITVRGVVRPADLSPLNAVQSERLAQFEVQINGKGVVADSVRRPMFLYRLLLGLLPF